MNEQLSLDPSCPYCGPLKHHKRGDMYLHKCGCPSRTEPYCQAHERGCGHFTDIRARKFGDWDPATAPIPF